MSEDSNLTPARSLDPTTAPSPDRAPDNAAEQSAAQPSPTPPADPSPEYDPDAPVDLAMDPVDFDIAHAGDHHVNPELHRVFKDSPTFITELPSTQYLVMLLLARGESIASIARRHAMSRTTIHRWLRYDARFIAAVNQSREIHRTEMDTRMSALSDRAVDNMEKSVAHGSESASKFVINHVSKMRRASQSPRVIAKRIARRKQRIKDFLNSPDEAPAATVIASTIGKPPALLESADASIRAEKSVDGKGTQAPRHEGTKGEDRTNVERNGGNVKSET